MVPATYWREKTGPTGHLRGLQLPVTIQVDSPVFLFPNWGPSLSARQFSPWKGREGRLEEPQVRLMPPHPCSRTPALPLRNSWAHLAASFGNP